MFFSLTSSPLEEVPVGGRSSNSVLNVDDVPLSRSSISAPNRIDDVPLPRTFQNSNSAPNAIDDAPIRRSSNSMNEAPFTRSSKLVPNSNEAPLPRSLNSLDDPSLLRGSNPVTNADDASLSRSLNSVPNGEEAPLPNRSSNSVDDAPLPRGGYNLDKVLEPSPAAISQESLIPCPTCGRTFLKVKLAINIRYWLLFSIPYG